MSEHGDDLRALDARKPLQEIVHARARLEILEQGAHRNPGAREHAGSSDAAGNAFNGGASRPSPSFRFYPVPRAAPDQLSVRRRASSAVGESPANGARPGALKMGRHVSVVSDAGRVARWWSMHHH